MSETRFTLFQTFRPILLSSELSHTLPMFSLFMFLLSMEDDRIAFQEVGKFFSIYSY